MTIEMILVAARKCFGCNAVRMGCVAVIFIMVHVLLLTSCNVLQPRGGWSLLFAEVLNAGGSSRQTL